jgi:hypothetical protein
MSSKTEALRALYLDVVGDETITEPKERGPSRDPIEKGDAEVETEVSHVVQQDGLDDAVEHPTGES